MGFCLDESAYQASNFRKTRGAEMKIQRPHCSFFGEECHGKACPAFIAHRPLNEYERKSILFADIPIIEGNNDTVSDWCNRYSIRVAETIVMEELT